MSAWEDLVSAALVGTLVGGGRERPAVPPELGPAFAGLESADAETALLGLAGGLGVYRQAGQRPPRTPLPRTPPASPDPAPPYPPAVGAFLERMWAGEHVAAFPEWLEGVSRRGERAPEAHLTQLLSWGLDKPALRGAILPVLGERGRWLARQGNPDWAWALGGGTDDAVWSEGAREARAEYLRGLRLQDPPAARALLEETWGGEPPEAKAALLSALGAGLSPADEGFLERVLDDRRKEVRQSAADLLARLPGSAYVGRMAARLEPLLAWTPPKKSFLRTQPPRLELALPEVFDKAMARDGLEQKPPYGKGEKAHWLEQMIERVPPRHWEERFAASPQELVRGIAGSEHEATVLEGWRDAVRRHRHSRDWVDALGAARGRTPQSWQANLYAWVEPPEVFEARVAGVLRRSSGPLEADDSPAFLAAHVHGRWGEELTRAFLERLRAYLGRPAPKTREYNGYRLSEHFKTYAYAMSPALAHRIVSSWPEPPPERFYWPEALAAARATLRFRAEMIQALEEAPR